MHPADDRSHRSLGVRFASRPQWVSISCLTLAVLAPLRFEFRAVVLSQDEGILLAYPVQILHGAVPNLSFESVYGAVSLWTIASSFKIFGYSLASERGVALIYWVILIGSMSVLVGRRRGTILGTLSGLVTILLLVSDVGLVAYAWIGAVALGALGMVLLDSAEQSRRPVLLLMSGVCFGLSVAFRLDLVVAVTLVTALIATRSRRRCWWFFSGILIGLIPVAINAVQAGLSSVIRGQFLQPVFATEPGRRLPISGLTHPAQIVLVLSVVAVAGIIATGVSSLRSDQSCLLLAVGLFDLGLLPEMFQRFDVIHVAFVACVVLPSALLVPALRPAKWAAGPVVAGGLIVAICPFVLSPYFATVAQSLGVRSTPSFLVNNHGRSTLVASRDDQRHLSALLAAIDVRANPGQRVFVGPDDLRRTNYNDTYLYFLLPQLTPGSFYLEMEPGVANAPSSHLAHDLRTNDWLVLTSAYDHWFEPNASSAFGSDTANRVILKDFHTVGQWGPWRLLFKN